METLKRFSRENEIGFPLIADIDRTIQTLYEEGRITFIIDREGIVRFIHEGVPDNERLLRELMALQ